MVSENPNYTGILLEAFHKLLIEIRYLVDLNTNRKLICLLEERVVVGVMSTGKGKSSSVFEVHVFLSYVDTVQCAWQLMITCSGRAACGDLYSPRNDPDPEMIANSKMIPKLTLK